MPYEKSAGIVIYYRDKSQIYYLILHYPALGHRSSKDYWDFTKGHVELGEREIDTALREAEEETGLSDLIINEGFKESVKYVFQFKGEKIFKTATFWLAESKTQKIKISGEHIGYEWATFEEAMQTFDYENSKIVLKKAHEFLLSRPKLL